MGFSAGLRKQLNLSSQCLLLLNKWHKSCLAGSLSFKTVLQIILDNGSTNWRNNQLFAETTLKKQQPTAVADKPYCRPSCNGRQLYWQQNMGVWLGTGAGYARCTTLLLCDVQALTHQVKPWGATVGIQDGWPSAASSHLAIWARIMDTEADTCIPKGVPQNAKPGVHSWYVFPLENQPNAKFCLVVTVHATAAILNHPVGEIPSQP